MVEGFLLSRTSSKEKSYNAIAFVKGQSDHAHMRSWNVCISDCAHREEFGG